MSEAELEDPAPRNAMPNPARRVWLAVAAVSAILIAVAALSHMAGAQAQPEGAAARKPAAVRVGKVTRTTLKLSAEHQGELTSDVAELSAQITGRVTEVRVNIGDRFAAGDLLARIDAIQAERQITEANAEVRSSDASRKRAEAELASAKTELERGRKLFAEKLITEQELNTLRSRTEVLRADTQVADAALARAKARVSVLRQVAGEARLTAPFVGAVAERYLDPGALVQPGSMVLRLVKSGPLRVRLRVPERDLGRVAPGLRFVAKTQATGPEGFAGKVLRVSAEVSRIDRTSMVEGVLDAEDPRLKPGMFASVTLELGTLKDANVVLGSALVEREEGASKRTGVFLLESDRAKWHPTEVLGRAGDRIAVTSLTPGQTVLVFGHEALKDGAAVRVTENSSSP